MLTRTRLRALMHLTVGLGIAAYCVAEEDWTLALLSLPVWALAWPVSFGPRGKPLPQPLIYSVVLAALAYAGLRIVNDSHDLIIAVSRLLMWLQIAKLYDRFTLRDRGMLLIMSIALVIGACLTSNSLLLGVFLLVYLPVMLWTSLLSQLGTLGQRYGREAPKSKHAAPKLPVRRFRFDLLQLLGFLAIVSVVTSAGVFVLVPRGVGEGLLGGLGVPAGMTKTGFNDNVTLGSAGLISESKTPVLDLKVLDDAGRNIGSKDRSFLLRGAILNHYQDGRWTRSEATAKRDVEVDITAGIPQPLARPSAQHPIYRIEVMMHRRPEDHLFTVWRPVSITLERSGRLTFGQNDDELAFAGEGTLKYSVRWQPDGGGVAGARLPPAFTQGQIQQLAASLLESVNSPVDAGQRSADETRRAADAMVEYLHRNYFYTLEMTAPRNGEDPIDMFLFRTKEGHCEYFASAMTAMSRSVGIEARVVTGYMAVEFNEQSGLYTVRESNAHAWVEVRLGDSGWVSYDPSPPDDLAIIHEPAAGAAAFFRSVMDGVGRWWVNAVVGFNETRRMALVGRDPLNIENIAQRVFDSALLPERMGGRSILLVALLKGGVVFGLTAAVGLFGAQMIALVLAGHRKKKQQLARLGGGADAAERYRQRVVFDRMLRTLARAKLDKPGWRPAKDHAKWLRTIDEPLADVVVTITDLHYTMRFGGRLLSEDEFSLAQRNLTRLTVRLREIDLKKRVSHHVR